MIDHVSVGVRDLASATRFYDAVLATLGLRKLEERPATVAFGKSYSEFWINHRPEMTPLPAGHGPIPPPRPGPALPRWYAAPAPARAGPLSARSDTRLRLHVFLTRFLHTKRYSRRVKTL